MIINDLNRLKEPFQTKAKLFIKTLKERDIEFTITETLREKQVQEAYYAQGREELEKVNAMRVKAGLWKISPKENTYRITWTHYSRHMTGLALDVVPTKNGRAWWSAPDEKWKEIADIAVECGLESGYYWTDHRDKPHYQEKGAV